MKQLLIFAVSVLSFSVAKAQVSKEETIAFLDRTVKEAVGSEFPYCCGRITAASFQANEISYSSSNYLPSGRKIWDKYEVYSDIRWDAYKEMELRDNAYFVIFTNGLNHKQDYTNNYGGKPDETKNTRQASLYLVIPPNKAESVKKAILRLVEIAKEENKDPFAD